MQSMTPLVGLMKLMEMGMEKGGMRDSMATRQAMEAKRMADLAQNPMMSAIPNNPMNMLNPGMSGTQPMQSPVESPLNTPVNTSPDFFDKAMKIAGMLGPGGSLQNPTPQSPRAIQPTVVDNLNPQPQGQPGILTLLKLMGGMP